MLSRTICVRACRQCHAPGHAPTCKHANAHSCMCRCARRHTHTHSHTHTVISPITHPPAAAASLPRPPPPSCASPTRPPRSTRSTSWSLWRARPPSRACWRSSAPCAPPQRHAWPSATPWTQVGAGGRRASKGMQRGSCAADRSQAETLVATGAYVGARLGAHACAARPAAALHHVAHTSVHACVHVSAPHMQASTHVLHSLRMHPQPCLRLESQHRPRLLTLVNPLCPLPCPCRRHPEGQLQPQVNGGARVGGAACRRSHACGGHVPAAAGGHQRRRREAGVAGAGRV